MSDNEYLERIQRNELVEVSPAEVCSIQTAKACGIDDPSNYFKSEYNDVKTFNKSKDGDETNRTKMLCSQTSDESKAYTSCSLEHGIGFIRQSGKPENCITAGCPPGFVAERGGCKKPLEDYAISKRARCDERWYDWFMTPNYHLGNKYYSPKVGVCYKPCPAFHVPQFAQDPVDETSAGFAATEKLDRCVAKSDYIAGKYYVGSDYCPLAWIYRLTALPDTLTQMMNASLSEITQGNGDLITLQNNVAAEANALSAEASKTLENIALPTDQMMVACQTLNNDERVTYAYDVCSTLAEDDMAYNKLLQENGESEAIQIEKTKMLKQACNALFCNPKDTTNELINKAPVCIATSDVSPIIEEEKEPSDPPSADPGLTFIRTSIRWTVLIIFGVIVIIFLLLFLIKVLIPFLMFVYELLRVYVFGGFRRGESVL
jgi:hypothetical protein